MSFMCFPAPALRFTIHAPGTRYPIDCPSWASRSAYNLFVHGPRCPATCSSRTAAEREDTEGNSA